MYIYVISETKPQLLNPYLCIIRSIRSTAYIFLYVIIYFILYFCIFILKDNKVYQILALSFEHINFVKQI